MIKVNELRIRNLVKINNDMLTETEGEIYKVSGFNLRFDMAFTDSTGTISLDHTRSLRTYSQFDQFIEPIELTEDWLLKFGFLKNIRIDCGGYKRTCVWSNYSFSITIWDDGRLFYDWLGGNIEVKYVHQLQNLYFALTGVELQLSSI